MSLNSRRLLFVYNADSGLFNTVADIGHKIFSPDTYSCQLCALTHGYFAVHKEWTGFIKKLGVKCEFLHKDEYIKQFGTRYKDFPIILLLDDSNRNLLMDANEINICKKTQSLQLSSCSAISYAYQLTPLTSSMGRYLGVLWLIKDRHFGGI